MAKYELEPLTLKEANEFIEKNHRHHKRVQGHRYTLGARENGELVGVVTVGRPVARLVDQRRVAEVTRLCVLDGKPNLCSFLYSAAARTAKEMGFHKIQTYILESERGDSLRASGWSFETASPGGQWKHTDGKPRRTDQPTEPKARWAKVFR